MITWPMKTNRQGGRGGDKGAEHSGEGECGLTEGVFQDRRMAVMPTAAAQQSWLGEAGLLEQHERSKPELRWSRGP